MTTYSLVKPRDLTNTAAFSGDLTAKWLYVDNADGDQAEKLSLSALDARWLAKSGGAVSGELIFNNNIALRWRDAGGTSRRAFLLTGGNVIQFGPVDTGWGSSTLLKAGTTISLQVNGASGSFATSIFVNTNRRVELGGGTNPSALLHINQSSATGGQPLHIEQDDVSEEFIRFTGQAAAGNKTQSFVAAGAVGTFSPTGYVRINIQDEGGQISNGFYYLQFGTIA